MPFSFNCHPDGIPPPLGELEGAAILLSYYSSIVFC